MPLQIGIIGLPNVGKSTIFNVLTQTQKAEVANYPFCTIEPNLAVVPVPDHRLVKLAELVGVDQTIHTTIEFLDIAGLVQGASQGEGLGNQFLGTIRNTDALLHVVRCFEDPNVVHVSESPQPKEDIEIIQLELILADLEQVDKKIDKLSRQIKGDKRLEPDLITAGKIKEYLENGDPLAIFPGEDDSSYLKLNQELRFLSAKPVIYAANIGEEYLNNEHPDLILIRKIAEGESAEVVQISAQIESDLNQINTYNENEVRSWTLQDGATASQAAGRIHTDFEKGFIKADVIPFDIFAQFGSTSATKDAGKLQIEGKDYRVKDGDVIYFKFNI
jgi:GTP-binding protein YchF